MKNVQLLMVCLLILSLVSCRKEEDVKGISPFIESFDIQIDGSHPDGAIHSEIKLGKADSGGGERIKLTGLNSNKTSLTIVINLPAQFTESGKKESIGLVVTNFDAEEPVWTKEDTYKTYPSFAYGQQRKRAIIDYIIDLEGDTYSYGSLVDFTNGSISLKRNENTLIGNFAGTIISNSGDGKVMVKGNFVASLSEDDLE